MSEAQQEVKQLTRNEKAAVLLLCMDEGATADLFGQMKDEEIRKIANALLHLSYIPSAQIQTVIDEFSKGFSASREKSVSPDVTMDGGKALENLLGKTLPRGRGQQIMQNIHGDESKTNTENDADFKANIQKHSADTLFSVVGGEHPQIVAVVLTNLQKKNAREFLLKFPKESQPELISRMAGLTKVAGAAMQDLQGYVLRKLAQVKATGGSDESKKAAAAINIEGMLDTVKLLKSLSREDSMLLVEEVEKYDAEIGALIAKQMFTIEDFERAEDVGIRELLRGITNDDLKIALKNTAEAVKEKFFGNMSKRAAMILREDMEVLPPLKVDEIEAAQANIIKVAKELIKEGKFNLSEAPSAGDEE